MTGAIVSMGFGLAIAVAIGAALTAGALGLERGAGRLCSSSGSSVVVILHTIAACRGAIDGLTAVVLEGHVRHHLISEHTKSTSQQREAADDLIAILRAYLR